ncbi:EAL domain-containing protein, partial [Neptunomonas phycophila]|uniref:EAL domain-containing protein n=1 Tax=Neptunomonas phycophila TaxID=1572645 RepID=UPI0026E28760
QGIMSPGVFLPFIEELGLMVTVGSWVIEQACAQADKWRKAGFPYFKVAVNIAVQQILKKVMVDWVSQMMKKYYKSTAQLE